MCVCVCVCVCVFVWFSQSWFVSIIFSRGFQTHSSSRQKEEKNVSQNVTREKNAFVCYSPLKKVHQRRRFAPLFCNFSFLREEDKKKKLKKKLKKAEKHKNDDFKNERRCCWWW